VTRSPRERFWVALASSQACQWFVILAITLPLHAQDKKEDKKKDTPKITCVTPLAVIPGVTKTLKLRGLSLADATAVKLTTAAGDPIPATIKSKTKSDPPKPFDAPKAGDSEAQIELTLPPATKPGDLALILTTPAGDTAPFKLPLADPATTIEEKEPNGGFKTAQELPLNKTVLGAIQEPNDVDVYRIGGKAGTKTTAEVLADRKGSLLDATLTLYDAAGHVLATADDTTDSRDPILKFTLPTDAAYYLALIDANDRGSPTAHGYQLTVREDR